MASRDFNATAARIVAEATTNLKVIVDADYLAALEDIFLHMVAFDEVSDLDGNHDQELDAAGFGQWEAYDRVQAIRAGSEYHGKNAAAVALGRLGGRKGGPARFEKLSAERRREIGKMGAAKRWAKS